MIKPTNGRVVLFQPGAMFKGSQHDKGQLLAGTIVHVFSDRMVNLSVFDSTGYPYQVTGVQLLQDDDKPTSDFWAEWMLFQKGQAAKTEQLEREQK